jgi:hypothetical protein
MIYVIRVRGVHRGRSFGTGWRAKALIFFLSAVLAAALVGALLGALGAALSASTRHWLLLGGSLLGAALGGAELLGRRVWLLQRDRETNQSWMRYGAIVNSAANGIAIGVGFSTRIGYWLWYVLPVVAVFYGSWKVGVVLFVVYSSIRAGIAVVLSGVGEKHDQSAHRLQDRLVSLKPLMRTACAGTLVVVSITFALTAGAPR